MTYKDLLGFIDYCGEIWARKNGFSCGESKDPCIWAIDTDYIKTGCAEIHVFLTDGPDENGYKYCPYCGRTIEVEPCNP